MKEEIRGDWRKISYETLRNLCCSPYYYYYYYYCDKIMEVEACSVWGDEEEKLV
jgi:hypothetical protein